MGKQNKKIIRLKRSKLQQSVISICCMLLMITSFVWIVNSAITTKGVILSDESSAVVVEVKKEDENKEQESEADNSVQEGDNKNESKADDKSAADNKDGESKSDESKSDKDDESGKDSIDDEFEDAAFIGDSRTVGLQMNTNIPKASFYASIGLNVSTALTDKKLDLANGNKGTVLDGMKEKQFKRIYIMFGINELGWPYPDVFQEKYEELVNKVKELQPDAKIYVQSILPVSSKATKSNKVFTNANVNKFNELLKDVAKNTGSTYLDVASVFKDANGELPAEASTDGIHLVHDYCQQWLDYLAKNT